jgi:hypothetical protein
MAQIVFPYNSMELSKDIAVNEVVTVAVKIEMMTKPTNTQKKANTLAMKDLGARSPYPTVVMETKAHQKPSQDPRKKEEGNSSGFQYESSAHITMPDNIAMICVKTSTGHPWMTESMTALAELDVSVGTEMKSTPGDSITG